MRQWILSFAVITLCAMPVLANPVFAKANAGSEKMKVCAANWNAMSAGQKKATTYQKYSASCMSGKTAMAASSKAMLSPQARMKACAADWQKMKAEGKTGGQTYRQFTAQCAKKN